MSVSKTAIKEIYHRAHLRDMIDQLCAIYACTGTYNARHFIGLRYSFRYLKAKVLSKS